MTPALCNGLYAPLGTLAFAQSYRVLLHEGAHASGIRNEACAEAYVWANSRRFLYSHYLFDPWYFWLSSKIAKQIETETLRRPPSYQPHLC